MTYFDSAQNASDRLSHWDSLEGRDTRPLVDMANPAEVSNLLRNNDRNAPSVTDQGHLIFSNPFEPATADGNQFKRHGRALGRDLDRVRDGDGGRDQDRERARDGYSHHSGGRHAGSSHEAQTTTGHTDTNNPASAPSDSTAGTPKTDSLGAPATNSPADGSQPVDAPPPVTNIVPPADMPAPVADITQPADMPPPVTNITQPADVPNPAVQPSNSNIVLGVEAKIDVGGGSPYSDSTATVAQQIAGVNGQLEVVPGVYDLTDPSTIAAMQADVATNAANGIKTAFEVNVPWNMSPSVTPSDAFASAEQQGQAFAQAFGNNPSANSMVLLGDETDANGALAAGGSLKPSYVSYFQGFEAGMADAGVKMPVEINATTAGVQAGFFSKLQDAGVQFDLAGVHPYLPSGSASDVQTYLTDVIQSAQQQAPNAKISISEINGSPGPSNNPDLEAQILSASLAQIKQLKDQGAPINDVVVYEAQNEPASGDPADQGSYGINNPQASAAVRLGFANLS